MADNIMLNDLLNISEKQLQDTRVRFHINNGKNDPLTIFLQDSSQLQEWQYWNSKQFKVGQLSIGFVRMPTKDEWLLFTIDTVIQITDLKGATGVGCVVEPVDKYNKYLGRVVVKYPNKNKQTFRVGSSIFADLTVSRILETVYSGKKFEGYHNVRLSYYDLELIIKGKDDAYRNALSNQKAVYVLTDKKTKQLYIGSATSEKGMLLKRWSDYINDCSGGNKKLTELVQNKGVQYFKDNFQFSIIENYNCNIDDDYILNREKYWKEVFCSRGENGYNIN